jgi:redox-sensitive bicupin YhaK (pirin superfamily)
MQPQTGFPTHAHREAEIFSYIVTGQLSHKDSMANVETMKRGDVQMTSGGSGIKHSEYNGHDS